MFGVLFSYKIIEDDVVVVRLGCVVNWLMFDEFYMIDVGSIVIVFV